jgi:hypothetical protein
MFNSFSSLIPFERAFQTTTLDRQDLFFWKVMFCWGGMKRYLVPRAFQHRSRGTIYGLTFGNAASENGSGRTQNWIRVQLFFQPWVSRATKYNPSRYSTLKWNGFAKRACSFSCACSHFARFQATSQRPCFLPLDDSFSACLWCPSCGGFCPTLLVITWMFWVRTLIVFQPPFVILCHVQIRV